MVAEHDRGLAEDGSKQHLCPLCPKVFGRRDHLKRHMYGHVENKAPKQRGRRPKEIDDEVSPISKHPGFTHFTASLDSFIQKLIREEKNC